jgi:hypothetical protein
VCVCCHGAGGDVLAFNSGDGSWTKKIELANGTQHKLTVAWRRAAGGDAAPTITGHTQDILGRISGYSGCIVSGDPFEAFASQNNAASLTVTAPTITPLTAGAMIIFAGCQSDTGAGLAVFSAYSGTNPTFSEAINNNFPGATINPAIFLADGIDSDASATGARTATSTTSLISSAALLALTPAGAAATGPLRLLPQPQIVAAWAPEQFIQQALRFVPQIAAASQQPSPPSPSTPSRRMVSWTRSI